MFAHALVPVCPLVRVSCICEDSCLYDSHTVSVLHALQKKLRAMDGKVDGKKNNLLKARFRLELRPDLISLLRGFENPSVIKSNRTPITVLYMRQR
eukprot:3068273-Pleurochrysis_carterae.AAC.1